MRVNTVFKNNYPFEYWILKSDTTGNVDYGLSKSSMGIVVPGGPNALYLIADEQMQIPMQIRNLRDPAGNVLTQVGGVAYPMYIHAAEPQFDPFGTLTAWKHTLRRELPRDFTNVVREIIEANT